MGVTVTFDYPSWAAVYTEFSQVSQNVVTAMWNRATMFHRNDGGGPVSVAALQTELLNVVTAHLLTLHVQSQGDASPGTNKDANTPVGRISSATEGSVTAQFDVGSVGRNEAWWSQTKYGAEYWQLTRPYRTMRYQQAPVIINNPWPYG